MVFNSVISVDRHSSLQDRGYLAKSNLDFQNLPADKAKSQNNMFLILAFFSLEMSLNKTNAELSPEHKMALISVNL